jgi:hypothetical protein
VKIEEGKSTEAPVCGMVYLVHLIGCAETVDVEAASAKAPKATNPRASTINSLR